jgi:hypothetical protein
MRFNYVQAFYLKKKRSYTINEDKINKIICLASVQFRIKVLTMQIQNKAHQKPMNTDASDSKSFQVLTEKQIIK